MHTTAGSAPAAESTSDVPLVVLIGGARSGKSALAIQLAAASGAPVTVIATGEAGDEEMAARIAVHRAERPAGWETVEEPLDLQAAIEGVPADRALIVDCLSLWAANAIERLAARAVERAGRAAAAAAAARPGLTVA